MSFNDWKEVRLSEIMTIIGGGTPKTKIDENTGEEIQALECYFLDEEGESCFEDEAIEVCFNAYDYDNEHDFSFAQRYIRARGNAGSGKSIAPHFIVKRR